MLTDDGTFDGGLRTVATHAPAGTVGRDGRRRVPWSSDGPTWPSSAIADLDCTS